MFDGRAHDEEGKTSDEAWRMLGIDPAVEMEKRRNTANNKRLKKMVILEHKENGIKIITKTHLRKNKFNGVSLLYEYLSRANGWRSGVVFGTLLLEGKRVHWYDNSAKGGALFSWAPYANGRGAFGSMALVSPKINASATCDGGGFS